MSLQTIGDVLTELDGVIAWARQKQQRAGYFAVLYRTVTARVAAGIEAGRFEDGARMERLDVRFATRYLDALARFRQGGSPSRSWAVAFAAAGSWPPIILQHLLLGINAHINLDLAIAAAQTSPGAELADLRNDFDAITGLLGEMLDDVQDRIARVSPWMGVLDRVGQRGDEELVGFALREARAAAWTCAQTLAIEDGAARDAQIDLTDVAVAALGVGIRSPAPWLRPFFLAVRWREPNDAATVIDALTA